LKNIENQNELGTTRVFLFSISSPPLEEDVRYSGQEREDTPVLSKMKGYAMKSYEIYDQCPPSWNGKDKPTLRSIAEERLEERLSQARQPEPEEEKSKS